MRPISESQVIVPESRARETTVQPEKLLSLLTVAMAGINLVSAITPALLGRMLMLERIFPLQVRQGTRLATALAGFALLVLASGIWRGKRTAWIVTLAVLAVSSITHMIKGFNFEEASVSLILLVGLVVSRKRFQARSDSPSILRGFRVLGIALGFTLVYGMIGFSMLDHHFAIRYNLWQAAMQTVRMFTQFTDPGLIATTRFGRYFTDSIYIIGISTIGYALLALLAPVLIRIPADSGERQRAAEIVREYGQTVLARFCLFPDKHYFFSPGGSLVAYSYKNRTAIVLGDPIGPLSDALMAVKAFQAFCSRNDWQLAFYQTRQEMLSVYQRAGLKSIKIGEEAIVDLSSFTLKGGEMKPLRTTVNKMERLGYVAQISRPIHDEALMTAWRSISDNWLKKNDRKEMKFSLGWFDREYLNSTPVISVVDPDGRVVAFANLVDEYQYRELAVDLMRRTSNTPPGTMDYLFVSMLQYAQLEHYDRFNLGLSGLAGVGESSADPAIERALHFIYTNVNTAYNFKGLHSFKQKFSPTWMPRYLVYQSVANLPAVAVALNELSA